MRKLPYQSSLQFIQRPQLLWNDIGDRKLWRGIQWIRRGPTVPSRLSWNTYQSNIPKPRSGVRWKHGMRRFSEYGNVASRNTIKVSNIIYSIYKAHIKGKLETGLPVSIFSGAMEQLIEHLLLTTYYVLSFNICYLYLCGLMMSYVRHPIVQCVYIYIPNHMYTCV